MSNNLVVCSSVEACTQAVGKLIFVLTLRLKTIFVRRSCLAAAHAVLIQSGTTCCQTEMTFMTYGGLVFTYCAWYDLFLSCNQDLSESFPHVIGICFFDDRCFRYAV